MTILGFDPGRDKCGVAVMSAEGTLFYHEVIPAGEAIATLARLCDRFAISIIAMGDRTTSKCWQQKLQAALPNSIEIVMVDEHHSTLEARDRYWQMYPPQGLSRLVPKGMRVPPRPIDDLVAILLIERYFQQRQATTSPTKS